MEDKLEYILYLILGLGALAANIYKNYDKRKREQKRKEMANNDEFPDIEPPQPRPQSHPVFPDLETLLGIPKEEPEAEVEFNEEQIEEPEKVVVPSQVVKEGEAVFHKTEEELVTDNLLAEKDFSISEFVQRKEKESLLETEDDEKSPFEFEPLQAVIYSEILKRPEY